MSLTRVVASGSVTWRCCSERRNRSSQSNACASRVIQPPKDLALRAGERIGEIFGNAIGIFAHDLDQSFLPSNRNLVESTAITPDQFRAEFQSCLDCPKCSLRGPCPLLRSSARFGCFCAGGVRSGERNSSSQRSLSKPRIARRAGAVGIAPLSHGRSPNGNGVPPASTGASRR